MIAKRLLPLFLALAALPCPASDALTAVIEPAPPEKTPAGGYFPEATPFGAPVNCGPAIRMARVLNPRPVAGEPVVVEIRHVAPPSIREGDTVECHGLFAWGLDLFARIQPPSGLPFSYEPLRVNPTGRHRATTLGRGQKIDVHVTMAYDKDSVSTAAFESPGPHQMLLAILCDPVMAGGGEPTTQQLGGFVIDVQAPEGDDLVAWNIMKEAEAFEAIQRMRPLTPAQGAALIRVVTEAPKSALRPFAIMALANGESMQEQESPEEALKRLRTLYEQFLGEYPHHFLARPAALRLLDVYNQAGLAGEERALLARMWSDPYLSDTLVVGSAAADVYFEKPEPDPEMAMDWMALERIRPVAGPPSPEAAAP